ncbi:MAG: hypothetical protein R3272_14865 [Candidatus Promineifilaceae bacterium]|nr:hypothetical protein [Candidatus Promineifilaceae bacterium]
MTTNRQRVAFALFFVLGSLLLTGLVYAAVAGEETEKSVPRYPLARVMFFIPDDPALLEPEVAVERLRDEAPYPLGFTSRWAVVEMLARRDRLDALMIHHAALEEVDWEAVQQWLLREGVVVGGLGIPGDELAERVGMPGLYDRYMGGYTTPLYFFIYSYRIEGNPADITRVEAAGLDRKPLGIKNPLSQSAGGSTDSLLVEDGMETMFHVLEMRVQGQQELAK